MELYAPALAHKTNSSAATVYGLQLAHFNCTVLQRWTLVSVLLLLLPVL